MRWEEVQGLKGATPFADRREHFITDGLWCSCICTTEERSEMYKKRAATQLSQLRSCIQGCIIRYQADLAKLGISCLDKTICLFLEHRGA
jgi:hypothetical protein